MNTELRKKVTNDFEKDFFKLTNNPVLWKIMVNVRIHRDIQRVPNETRKNYLVSEPSSYNNFFPVNLLAIEMKITQITMNKPVYLCLYQYYQLLWVLVWLCKTKIW